MKDLLKSIEELINTIGKDELAKNPRASAKAIAIKNLIKEIRRKQQNINDNSDVLKYLSPRHLLEN